MLKIPVSSLVPHTWQVLQWIFNHQHLHVKEQINVCYHINSVGTLVHEQFSFTKDLSTNNAMHTVQQTNDLLYSFSNENYVLEFLFCDFAVS
jgi:hypothetical protein